MAAELDENGQPTTEDEGWNDEMNAPAEIFPYLFVSHSQLLNGEWSSFSNPVLWKKWENKEKDDKTDEAKKKRDEENKEKRARMSVLRGVAIRIPLLVYGAEINDEAGEEITIDNFASEEIVDQASWEEFMPKGFTKQTFNILKDCFDGSIFTGAAKRIRQMVKEADNLNTEDRIAKIATIFSYFHNPDKETVLTPWRVVNMHMSDTVGGWCFWDEDFVAPYTEENQYGENVNAARPVGVTVDENNQPHFTNEVTKDIFGDYIHTYFYNASIADGYTRRLIREDIGSNYKIKLKEALNSIRVKVHSVKESDVYAHHVYVQPLLDYIIEDLRTFRQKNEDNTLGGMVVCNSKEQAQLMYRLFLEKYADESELDNETDEDGSIVYKSISAGEMEVKKKPCKKGCYRAALITYDSFDKETRAKWIELFKDGKIDLLIVFQMLQTGFDAPRLKKLYLHRMVKEHNLLQTLTRVNRPYKDMKYGYVVDFANIEEEYSKTNKEYQEELEHEVGKDNIQNTDRLLVSMDEAKKRVDDAKKVLDNYELGNPEIFSRQLNLEDDRNVVRTVLNSLEDMRSLQNMLTSQGSNADEVVEISDIHNLIKAAKNRLDLLGFIDNSDENANAKQLLNMALENIEFSFEKRGEGELEIQEQYKQSVEHARQQLKACVDTDDPEYRSILEEFLRLFRKKEMESQEEFNMHKKVQNVNDILRRIKKLNERDALEAIKYNGDTKFVRVEKRLKEKDKEETERKVTPRNYAWTEEKEKMTIILLAIKEDVDDVYFHNQSILEVPEYFKKNILTYVTRHFKEEAVKTDREVRKYVSEIINREYQIAR